MINFNELNNFNIEYIYLYFLLFSGWTFVIIIFVYNFVKTINYSRKNKYLENFIETLKEENKLLLQLNKHYEYTINNQNIIKSIYSILEKDIANVIEIKQILINITNNLDTFNSNNYQQKINKLSELIEKQNIELTNKSNIIDYLRNKDFDKILETTEDF